MKKKKASRNPRDHEGGRVFLFPGPEGWEEWRQTGDQYVCVGPQEDPKKLRPPPDVIFCLPSRYFISLPCWVPSVEGPPTREQVSLRLESRGVLGATPETAVWAMEPIRLETMPASNPEALPESRQLEATAILNGALDADHIVETAGQHEVAARSLPPPSEGQGSVLRKELGQWMLDLYLAGKWVHTQPLLARQLDETATAEIRALLAQFEAEGVFPRLEILVVRDNESREVPPCLRSLASVVRWEVRPHPRLGPTPWDLQPAALKESRELKSRSAQKQKTWRLGLMAYAAAMAGLFVYLFYPVVRLAWVKRDLEKISSESKTIATAARTWQEAGALLNPTCNVLEVLWQVARPLVETDPPRVEGVRLTLFDYNPRRLSLRGEAKDLELTQKYLDGLKQEPALGLFTWNTPQPRLLPNGNAQFQAEGTLQGTNSEAQEGGTDEAQAAIAP